MITEQGASSLMTIPCLMAASCFPPLFMVCLIPFMFYVSYDLLLPLPSISTVSYSFPLIYYVRYLAILHNRYSNDFLHCFIISHVSAPSITCLHMLSMPPIPFRLTISIFSSCDFAKVASTHVYSVRRVGLVPHSRNTTCKSVFHHSSVSIED